MTSDRPSNVISFPRQRPDMSVPYGPERDSLRDAIAYAYDRQEQAEREARRHTLAVLGFLAVIFTASAVGLWLVTGGGP
jgi:hypothetical protein